MAGTRALGAARAVLQSGDGVQVTLHTGLVVFALGAVAALLGLYISYQAYRGYRRNQSRPMLYLSVGIVLLTFVPSVLSTAVANLPLAQNAGIVAGMCSRIAGLLSVLYAIRYA